MTVKMDIMMMVVVQFVHLVAILAPNAQDQLLHAMNVCQEIIEEVSRIVLVMLGITITELHVKVVSDNL